MNHTANISNRLQTHKPAHFSPRYGCLTQGSVKAHSEMKGEMIHCTSGHLWVTFEGDTMDHFLFSGESLVVPNQGKTLVSGLGCYRISQSIDGMDLAVAS